MIYVFVSLHPPIGLFLSLSLTPRLPPPLRECHKSHLSTFHWPELIHMPTSLQWRLENKVSLCVWKEREMGFKSASWFLPHLVWELVISWLAASTQCTYLEQSRTSPEEEGIVSLSRIPGRETQSPWNSPCNRNVFVTHEPLGSHLSLNLFSGQLNCLTSAKRPRNILTFWNQTGRSEKTFLAAPWTQHFQEMQKDPRIEDRRQQQEGSRSRT